MQMPGFIEISELSNQLTKAPFEPLYTKNSE